MQDQLVVRLLCICCHTIILMFTQNKNVYDYKITKTKIHGLSLDFMIYFEGIGISKYLLFYFSLIMT